MATKTFEELKQLAIQIRDEKTSKANTATRIGTQMIEHLNKLEQEYYTIQTVDGLVSEYNVSVNHPTSGIDGSNKYTLSSAIALVPEQYRSIGIKCSFMNEAGQDECWEWEGYSWESNYFNRFDALVVNSIKSPSILLTAEDIKDLISNPGWIQSSGNVNSDASWVNGIIPIPSGCEAIEFTEWDSTPIGAVNVILTNNENIIRKYALDKMPISFDASGANAIHLSVRKEYLNKFRVLFLASPSNALLAENILSISKKTEEMADIIGEENADLSNINISGFVNKIDGAVQSNNSWRHGIITLSDKSKQIAFIDLPQEQYSSAVVNYFVDSDGNGIAGTEFTGDTILGAGTVEKEIPVGAKGLLLNAGAPNLSQYKIKIYTDGGHANKIYNLQKDILSTTEKIDGSQVSADLSAITNFGYLNKIDGVPQSNSLWRYGVIPIPDGSLTVRFNNLTEFQYSSAVVNYFVDSDGNGIAGTEFTGDTILGAGIIEKEIPVGAKGLMFNASRDSLPTYDISIEIGSINANIERLIDYVDSKSGGTLNEIICPDKFYAVVGKEFNLYYDSLIKGLDAGLQSPLGIYVDIQCPDLQNASNLIGVRRERMWQITGSKLTADYVGEHDLYITAYDLYGQLISKKSAKLVVSNSTALSSQKYILDVGDSLINNGPIVATMGQHFQDLGGTQPTFIGQRTTDGYKHEGYPGYTFDSFTGSGSENAYFIFDIDNGINVSIGDKYSTNSSTYTISDIRIEGQDNKLRLRCTRSGSTTPNQTGTLTKVSGASSSPQSIEYSAFEAETGNPFWDSNTGSINFSKYREKMGMGGNKFDLVVIMLGANDCILKSSTSLQGSVNNAIALINAILSDAGDYPTKIILQMTPPDANTISSWQVYGDMSSSRKMRYWDNLWTLRKLLYKEFSKPNWDGKVFLGQAALGIDRYYGYPYIEVTSSSRISTIKEIYHTNSVHPKNEGYQQLGDGYFLQALSLLVRA